MHWNEIPLSKKMFFCFWWGRSKEGAPDSYKPTWWWWFHVLVTQHKWCLFRAISINLACTKSALAGDMQCSWSWSLNPTLTDWQETAEGSLGNIGSGEDADHSLVFPSRLSTQRLAPTTTPYSYLESCRRACTTLLCTTLSTNGSSMCCMLSVRTQHMGWGKLFIWGVFS